MADKKCKLKQTAATTQDNKNRRGAGILMHLTSLPGSYGIGAAGPEAEAFLDFLTRAGQEYWQLLPLGPTSEAQRHSPYMNTSAFAGNPLLISVQNLLRDGWITRDDLGTLPEFSEYFVIFDNVVRFKEKIFHKAFATFKKLGISPYFQEFCECSPWLHDFALFESLKRKFKYLPWHKWPRRFAEHDTRALKNAAHELEDEILYHKFLQFLFDSQWQEIRKRAGEKGIRLIGDIPIYVAGDSSDVWAGQECFQLDPVTLRPTYVAGVPPDYFSESGQLWGNPLYRWQDASGKRNQAVYRWWERRFQRISELVDVVRIDHFRGFEAYWRVPAREKTAVNGKWVKGPGKAFFTSMDHAAGSLDIIAEDLGLITPAVEALRDSLGFPGMKVLQFAFDSGPDNPYLPWNYTSSNCVVYTGTHDNDTSVGWFMDEHVNENSKKSVMRLANSDGSQIHLDFIRIAYASTARVAIIPMQDVLGFGNDCRMNMPGTTSGNWIWRCAPRFITQQAADMLRDESYFYGRGRNTALDPPADRITQGEAVPESAPRNP